MRETKPGGKQELVKAIKSKLGDDTKVRVATRRMAIAIWDLDEVTTKEEIAAAIAEQYDMKDDVAVGAPRKGRNGIISALVRMPERNGKELLNHKRLKVGWLWCKVSEWITPPHCIKCQHIGHYVWDCKSKTSEQTKCYRCGENGHMAKKCEG